AGERDNRPQALAGCRPTRGASEAAGGRHAFRRPGGRRPDTHRRVCGYAGAPPRIRPALPAPARGLRPSRPGGGELRGAGVGGVAAGGASMVGELVSSGWQTMAITMRLVVDARLFGDAPLIGLGLDQARFLRPVRPGDELHVETEILSMAPSRIRADRGTAQVKVVTL